MLITFKSKAAADVTMYKEHAKRLLDPIGKDASQGIITAEQAARAVQVLEHEIEESRRHPTTEEVRRDVDAHHREEGEDAEHEEVETVSFAARAFPLLDMLRAARDGGHDVVWGV